MFDHFMFEVYWGFFLLNHKFEALQKKSDDWYQSLDLTKKQVRTESPEFCLRIFDSTFWSSPGLTTENIVFNWELYFVFWIEAAWRRRRDF